MNPRNFGDTYNVKLLKRGTIQPNCRPPASSRVRFSFLEVVKYHEEPHPCFGFPPWLVQVEANLVVRHSAKLATTETKLAGCRFAIDTATSGRQMRRLFKQFGSLSINR